MNIGVPTVLHRRACMKHLQRMKPRCVRPKPSGMYETSLRTFLDLPLSPFVSLRPGRGKQWITVAPYSCKGRSLVRGASNSFFNFEGERSGVERLQTS